MASNPTQTSYFCEDQIDELNETYFAFCSQYDKSTQYIQSQSQCEGSQRKDGETGDDLTEQPQPLDFQTAFIQFLGSVPPINSPDDSHFDLNVTTSQNVDSQTDFEARTHAVIIQNPHLADNAFKPTIEAFLECSQYFETIKASPKKVPMKAKGPSEEIRFKIGPQVLMIVDILKINIDRMNCGPLSSERMLYGQKFRSVMFYGRCQPDGTTYTKNDGNGSLSEHIKRKYIVDDGSARIRIHISQSTNSNYRGLKQAVNILKQEFKFAQEHGISFLGNDHHRSDTPKCKEMLECGESIMGVIDRNMAQNNDELRNGGKVCVVGAPFRNSKNNNIEIFVYRVYEDYGPDRQMELSFMNYVMHEYETKLFKFKITGERI